VETSSPVPAHRLSIQFIPKRSPFPHPTPALATTGQPGRPPLFEEIHFCKPSPSDDRTRAVAGASKFFPYNRSPTAAKVNSPGRNDALGSRIICSEAPNRLTDWRPLTPPNQKVCALVENRGATTPRPSISVAALPLSLFFFFFVCRSKPADRPVIPGSTRSARVVKSAGRRPANRRRPRSIWEIPEDLFFGRDPLSVKSRIRGRPWLTQTFGLHESIVQPSNQRGSSAWAVFPRPNRFTETNRFFDPWPTSAMRPARFCMEK